MAQSGGNFAGQGISKKAVRQARQDIYGFIDHPSWAGLGEQDLEGDALTEQPIISGFMFWNW